MNTWLVWTIDRGGCRSLDSTHSTEALAEHRLTVLAGVAAIGNVLIEQRQPTSGFVAALRTFSRWMRAQVTGSKAPGQTSPRERRAGCVQPGCTVNSLFTTRGAQHLNGPNRA